jgi:thiol-disulfide isomerase/thioredoxin
MKFLPLLCLLCSLSTQAQTQTASTICAPSPQVEQDLKRVDIGNGLPVEKSLEPKQRILGELLQKYPDDLFVHLEARGTFFSTIGQMAVVDQYRKLAQEHPKSLQYQYLYARALVDMDTPRAMDLLNQVETADAAYPWPYLEFAWIHSGQKYADLPRMRTELDKFFELCPNSLDWYAWSLRLSHNSPESAARYAHALRQRLMTDTDRDHLRYYWKMVWNLEFQAAPVAEHPQVRKHVAADLARLAQVPGEGDSKWLAFLSIGYGMADEPEAVKRVEEELVAKYPQTTEARSVLDERWQREHPWPEGDDPEDNRQAFDRAFVQRADELLKMSPNDSSLLMLRFTALSEIDGVTGDQLTAAADKLHNSLETDPIWQASPPVDFQIAQAFIKRNINLERVPGLVEEGLRLAREHQFLSDQWTDEAKTELKGWDLRIKTQAADLLARVAKQLKKPEIAKAAVAELDNFTSDKAEGRSAVWAAKAMFAEVEGRNLDALLMYQAAIGSRPSDFNPGKKDELAESENRLWKELGGSSASRDLWEKKAKISEVATEGRWQTPTKAMSGWELTDLQGHTWKMASLGGKTVLINVWASWCGPCQGELPQFQKIYDQLKDRPDFQVISFNIDDEIGKVEPFIRQQGYTFPVLLARSYVDDLLGSVGIPQVWIVDARGKWLWEQLGIGPDRGKWRESVLEKIESARAPIGTVH